MIDHLLSVIKNCAKTGVVQVSHANHPCSVMTFPVVGAPDNVVLSLRWIDDFTRHRVDFTEAALAEAGLDHDGYLYCTDTSGCLTRMRVLMRPPMFDHYLNQSIQATMPHHDSVRGA